MLPENTPLKILAGIIFLVIMISPISLSLSSKEDTGHYTLSAWAAQKDSPNQVNLPEGFPQIPTYPQALVSNSRIDQDEPFPKFKGEWSTGDRVPGVTDWYIDALRRDGWVIDQLPAERTNQLTQLVSAKKNNIISYLSVIRYQNDPFTHIIIEAYSAQLLEEEDETVTDIHQ